MANISLGADAALTGTTSDDTVTLGADLGATADRVLSGNGGNDTLVLNETLATFLGTTGEITFDGGTSAWEVDNDDGTDTFEHSLTNGFTTVQFADGIAVESGVASSGLSYVNNSAASGATIDLDTDVDTVSYDWNGFSFNGGGTGITTGLTVGSIVSVDGMDLATVGNNFTNADGAFAVVDSGSDATVTFTANASAVNAAGNPGETASFAYDVVIDDGSGNLSTVTLTYSETIAFSAGDDTFTGTDGNDTVDGLAGDDVLSGGLGNDDLTGGAGADTLNGGDGNDALVGGEGDDVISGGEGTDTLTETADTTGNNILNGNGGADVIDAGLGNDLVRGGGDADNIDAGAGNDTIFGGQGDDAHLDGEDGDDVINGGDGDDALLGGNGDDVLKGGDGDDALTGGAGADELRGGDGDDALDGEDGADTFYMSLGLGGDTMDLTDTDSAIDTIVLKANAGDVAVTAFAVNEDILDVSGLGVTDLAGVLAVAYEVGGDTILQLDADTEVTLDSVTLASLDADDFTFAV